MLAGNKKTKFRNVIVWLIFATNLIAIALLFCSFLSWGVSPLRTNLFSYIGLGFGIILLVNTLYLVLWITFARWGLAFVSLLAIVLCYKPVTTYFPLHLRSQSPGQFHQGANV